MTSTRSLALTLTTLALLHGCGAADTATRNDAGVDAPALDTVDDVATKPVDAPPPDVPAADVAQPDVAQPDVVAVDAPSPDVIAVDASQPDVVAVDAPADAPSPDVVAVDAPPPDVSVTPDAPSIDAPAVDVPTPVDARADVADVPADAPRVMSNIRHVIVISQENHTFDTYFGRYCTAPAGSNPTCTTGPACCEAAPAREPSGNAPVSLTDDANGGYDPNHNRDCENAEIHDGAMDRFVRGASCSDARNFAIAPSDIMTTYHGYARDYALADRYFQPIVGATASNDMYYAVARRVFHDNEIGPRSIGSLCTLFLNTQQFTDRTVADVVLDAGHTFGFYVEGYNAVRAVSPLCALPPSDCPAHRPGYPCTYDQSDVPFQYYRRFTDNLTYIKDYSNFNADFDARRLPEVTFVKAIGYRTEHPGYGTTIRAGEAFVDAIVRRVAASPYADDTLILLTWDEGGGYYDHVRPLPASPVDMEPSGTRVALLAIGRFARRNFVSHVEMEHSSIVRFLEWNFTGDTGQLRARDAIVNNLGSLLDPAATGVAVPEH